MSTQKLPTLNAGLRLGPYEVVGPIGAGGMGEVYSARDTRLDRKVAIKILPPDVSGDADRLRRFEQEARAASRLNHPNILTVLDIGSHGGAPFIVLELLEGESLRQRLSTGALPVGTAVDYATQIATGLAVAHEKGIVHRDLKPENLFITRDGLVKILDFGLAKLIEGEVTGGDPQEEPTRSAVTVAGTLLGTVGYMSPEQVRGESVDGRSDIFSFGAILYEMLSGRRAFQADTHVETLSAILKEEPPRLQARAGDAPPALETVVRHCLEKRPESRFQSARDLAFHLRSLSATSAQPVMNCRAQSAAARRVMLAVLPFANLGRDPEQEYFSDGLTEETIADLGGMASQELGVIARTSAMTYKGTAKGIAEIGRELGVDFAVEGGVRRHGDRVRISVRLVRTGDQTQLWAAQYDRELRDVLAIQDDLGRTIAEQVQVTLAPRRAAPQAGPRPVDQAAYDAYLHGRFHLWKVTRPDLERALEYFRRAAEIDPHMAAAHAGLAQTHMVLPIAGGADPREAFPRCERAAVQALELDPDSADALIAMTGLRHWYYWDWTGAEDFARRAIASNPSAARAHQVLGRLLANIGRHDEAIAEIDVARSLDPLAPLIAALSADFRLEARRYDEVEPLIRRAHELDPDFWVAHVSAARLHMVRGRYAEGLAAAQEARRCSGGHSEALALIGLCHGALGHRDEARTVLAELEHRRASGYVPGSHLAAIHLGLGDTDRAVRWLETACDERDAWLTGAAVKPIWDDLRTRPDFQALLGRIGFPPSAASPGATITATAPRAVQVGAESVLTPPALVAGSRQRRGATAVAAGALILAAAAVVGIVWTRLHDARVRWARDTAPAKVESLKEAGDLVGAYRLAKQALATAPDDPRVQQVWTNLTVRDQTITSDPPGADVAIGDYRDSGSGWMHLGTTPLKDARVPFGLLRWRLTKPGYQTLEVGQSAVGRELRLTPEEAAKPGMVLVPSGSLELESTGEKVELPDFWLDRYEVTNRQYKAFVDAGGYRDRELWKAPFVDGGNSLTWAAAMAKLRDTTGRPGPSTWALGTYPEGQADYPVGGVSWYEAAAYAAWAGTQLPTVYHWYRASGASGIFSEILDASNFSGKGPAPVGRTGGLGPFGTYDMAGNVKEWCRNPAPGGRRYLLGGGWNEPSYMFRAEDAQPLFARRPNIGFRCMVQEAPSDSHLSAEIATLERDPATLKPVDDDLYRAYLRLFDYDETPLEVEAQPVDDSNPEWRRERVRVRAAYGQESLPINLFIPRTATPPYQAVVFAPGSDADQSASSEHVWLGLVGFIVRTGRVLVYPIYEGTYERRIPGPHGPNAIRDLFIDRGKDIRRTVDYLVTRPDIDSSKVAYYGLSRGAVLGPLFLAIEPRFRTGVLLSGGFNTWNLPPEVDPVNFAPRVTQPVLMVNGREDFHLPYATAQVPMFRMLGTPAADKRHVVLEGGHVPPHPEQVIKVILDWLDVHLGPVR